VNVHEVVGREAKGLVLDIGCGEGWLADELGADVRWVGVDDSPEQLAGCEPRPVVRADMRALPFRTGCADTAVHLWCLYFLDDPVAAVAEARRVLRAGGRYCAATSPRDAEPTSFDAEEARGIVASVFDEVTEQRGDRSILVRAASA
jgi:SAM-dependent methyltransferase